MHNYLQRNKKREENTLYTSKLRFLAALGTKNKTPVVSSTKKKKKRAQENYAYLNKMMHSCYGDKNCTNKKSSYRRTQAKHLLPHSKSYSLQWTANTLGRVTYINMTTTSVAADFS